MNLDVIVGMAGKMPLSDYVRKGNDPAINYFANPTYRFSTDSSFTFGIAADEDEAQIIGQRPSARYGDGTFSPGSTSLDPESRKLIIAREDEKFSEVGRTHGAIDLHDGFWYRHLATKGRTTALYSPALGLFSVATIDEMRIPITEPLRVGDTVYLLLGHPGHSTRPDLRTVMGGFPSQFIGLTARR